MSANVLVTGSSGYIGRLLVEALATRGAEGRMGRVVAADVREPERLPASVTFVRHDVRDDGLADVLRHHDVTCVVHLASIVTPPKGSTRAVEYAVDVQGSRRVLDACIAANVRRLVVTSSGAAYGYHADNPAWLAEDAPLRGNESFAYSWHKRLVEEMLADCRVRHPSLEQVIFRVGTILGATVHNQITALFERTRLLAIRGSDSPFVFIHDADVVACLVRAVDAPVTGIFNVAGDGALSIREIAALLGKPVLTLPAWLLQGALAVARPLGLTRYGPEQVDFLRYRPVLDNARLKREFGYVPALTSREAFDRWRERGRADTGR
ncbi:MAG: SDR family oxidoreductase [Gemmatimonadetes bacterium]|nr:SDR family oxidoreductase [Gemmatimonadota bacterium]MBK8649902.1 SDR family oxidoreductase [Gemmatimonadota bacterium]MBK9410236.1 SDR family oxidoreductase [Gemmatimonadota bacterium]